MAEKVNFNNTQLAFAYKNNWVLTRDYGIFGLMSFNRLVNAGIGIADFLVKSGLSFPVVLGIKPTVFPLFCGGKSLKDSISKINLLHQYGIDSILDYGVEGKENEKDFDKTAQAIQDAILFATHHDGVKIVCSKFTSLIPFKILEKLHAKTSLTEEEKARFENCKLRIYKIAELAFQNKIALFVDAEESWIQNPLDELCLELMRKYNREQAIIYNTYQLYLKARFPEFENVLELSKNEGFVLGAKLVRGAYMEKETDYAKKHQLQNPIQPSKSDTDNAYNKAVAVSLENIEHISVCIATHNEESTLKAVELAQKFHIPENHPHLNFAQLLGMSDHISFNLAEAGYQVSKYMPYGPVSDVLPYLIRRAQENSSVSGQMNRELSLHHQEMKRRRLL
ncbi:MAG TPA: proline dehydrogenase family protein [Chitinophagales bacterium]|nr:proline dehydrogenase family protein [Chitinophagales bacterium]